MAHEDAPALLAAYVIEVCGEELARDVFHALRDPDVKRRAVATAGLYWGHAPMTWPHLDDVLRLHRYEITRRAVVVGLADRFGFEAPRVVESDREYGRRRTRDAAFHRMEQHFGEEPGTGGAPAHRARQASSG